MAQTINVPCFLAPTSPDDSGGAFWEPLSIRSTTTIWKHGLFTLNDSTADPKIHWLFKVPHNYTASTENAFIPSWTANATTGNVRLDVAYRTRSSTEPLNTTSAQQTVTLTDAAPAAAWRPEQPTMAVSSGNFAANDLVQGYLMRKGSTSADTIGVRVHIAELSFRCQISS